MLYLQPTEKAFLEGLQQLPPQERVASVRPLWESLDASERQNILTAPVDELRAYAKDAAARAKEQADAEAAEHFAAGHVVVSLDPPIDESFEKGIQRSQKNGTWKVWSWPPDTIEFYDSESFRRYLEGVIVPKELQSSVPKENKGTKHIETPAEAGLRQRMTDLLSRINDQRNAAEEGAFSRRYPSTVSKRQDPYSMIKEAHIEMIALMLAELEKEHEALYYHCLLPVTSCVSELLMDGSYKTTRLELAVEDLDSLLPDEIARIFEWLLEKVDGLTAKLKLDVNDSEIEEEEDPIGDVDLFDLVENGEAFRVNPKWLGHLQSRILGEDGQPRRSNHEEDPHEIGLVLEWVYGTIVSTAEKARDAAHRALGCKAPSVEAAVETFISALEDHATATAQAKLSRELMSEILENRKASIEYEKQYNLLSKLGLFNFDNNSRIDEEYGNILNGTCTDLMDSIPYDAIIFMLKRESLLTSAKLHFLALEQISMHRKSQSLKFQLQQGEPQFERLKRQLDDLKSISNARALDGNYRVTSDVDKQRIQLADSNLDEQLRVQSSLREKSVQLQRVLESRRECDINISRRDKEIASLSKWKASVDRLIANFKSYSEDISIDVDEVGRECDSQDINSNRPSLEIDVEAGVVTEQHRNLAAAVRNLRVKDDRNILELREHFKNDLSRQLYSHKDDKLIFDNLKSQLQELEKQLDAGQAALQHLESYVINLACDDPGIGIGSLVILPFLQGRLDARALNYAAEKAAAAEDDILRMETEMADRERAEKEKRDRAKSKQKERQRIQRERDLAEAEEKYRQEQEKERLEKELAGKTQAQDEVKRAQELEEMKKLEEELMEKRRRELLEEEKTLSSKEIKNACTYTQARQLSSDVKTTRGPHCFAPNQKNNPKKKRKEKKKDAVMCFHEETKKKTDEGPSTPPSLSNLSSAKKCMVGENAKQFSEVPSTMPSNSLESCVVDIKDRQDTPYSRDREVPHLRETKDAQEENLSGAYEVYLGGVRQESSELEKDSGYVMGERKTTQNIGEYASQNNDIESSGEADVAYGDSGKDYQLPRQQRFAPNHAVPIGNVYNSCQPQAHFAPHLASGFFPAGSFMPGMYPNQIIPPIDVHQGPFRPPPILVQQDGQMFFYPNQAVGLSHPGVMPGHHQNLYAGRYSDFPAAYIDGINLTQGDPTVITVTPSAEANQSVIEDNGDRRTLDHRTQGKSPLLNVTAAPFIPSTKLGSSEGTSISGEKGLNAESSCGIPDDGNFGGSAEWRNTHSQGESPRGILETNTIASNHDAPENSLSKSSSLEVAGRSKDLDGECSGSSDIELENTLERQNTADCEVIVHIHKSENLESKIVTDNPKSKIKSNSLHKTQLRQSRKPESIRKSNFVQKPGEENKNYALDKLCMTQGLMNAPGLYNCFLNVVVQCLWHLSPFRKIILERGSHLEAKKAIRQGSKQTAMPQNAILSSAIFEVFNHLYQRSRSLHSDSIDSMPGLVSTHVSKTLTKEPEYISVERLREVLSITNNSIAFNLSDMHDAGEVLAEIFERLHFEEVGPNQPDPTLPKHVLIPAAELNKQQNTPIIVSKNHEKANGGSVWNDATALQNVKRSLRKENAGAEPKKSYIQRLFGIEVQAPCSSSDW